MRLLSVAVGWLGCSGSPLKPVIDTGGEAMDPLSWSLTEPGPFSVGFESWEVTYTPGEGVVDRTVRINLWYPTNETTGNPAAYTFGVDPLSIAGAEPAPPVHVDGYPLHTFSHGDRSFGEATAFMNRHMASHGWVTVTPNHADNTLVDHQDPLSNAHYAHRPLDIRAALDAVEGLDDEHPLAGRINTERVMMSGHSRGAYTTWAVLGAAYDPENVAEMCASGDNPCTAQETAMFEAELGDPRVVATMPMAGTLRRSWFGADGELAVHGPVLFMGATEDQRGQDTQFESMGAIDFTWMEIEGGCHETFSLGTCATLDRETGYAIVRAVGLGWARYTVLGDRTGQTLDAVSGVDPALSLVTTQRLGGQRSAR